MPNILIVDDEPDILEFQQAFLARRNHNVTTASKAEMAIELIKHNEFDVVFCDLKLEGELGGMHILEQSKKIKPSLTFYLISGFVDKETEEKGLQLGAREVLNKPINNDKLEEKISEVQTYGT